MAQNPLFNEIKRMYHSGAMHIRLIMVNAIIFVAIGLLSVFGRLMGIELEMSSFSTSIFALRTDLVGFITHPWGILTSIFAHFGFMHFLFNMLMLFVVGQLFLQFFSGKRLLSTYLLGGIFGGLLEIVIHQLLPNLAPQGSVIVGASGSIMGIFIALAFYRPQLQVTLFGILPIRLFILALLFLLSDLLAIGKSDGTAHFAHLGGALLGYLSVRNLNANTNIVSMFSKFLDQFFRFIKSPFGPKKLKVVKTDRRPDFKSDEQYALEKKLNQEKTDAILDKISRAGYDSLSKAEKDFLFKQSSK
ncbi:MAG: rhomboid family intramembrane serine protease [Crocinitomicaceae bacterium]